MFQTHIHQFLQQFDAPFLVQLMKGVTAMGYPSFFVLFIIYLLFSIDFKKGFTLFLVLMWTAALTLFLKESFSLPRPYHVDQQVQNFDAKLNENQPKVQNGGATTFWSTLPKTTLAFYKNESIEYGLPSGHTSIALAFWGVFFLLFPKRWTLITAVSLATLIPFSRLYLGVHFIADVLAGYLVGMFSLFIFLLFEKNKKHLPKNSRLSFFLLGILPVFWFFLLSEESYQVPASMLGGGIGFLLLPKEQYPINQGKWQVQTLKFILAFTLFAVIGFCLKSFFEAIDLGESGEARIFRYLISTFVLIFGGGKLLHKIF